MQEPPGEVQVVFERDTLKTLETLGAQGRSAGLQLRLFVLVPGSPAGLLRRMITGPLDPALFAPSCLQAVPEAQLRAQTVR